MSTENPNVLAMAVGSPLGQSITKALQISEIPGAVHGADVSDLAAGLYLDGVHPVVLPYVRDPSYLGELSAYVTEHRIAAIFPVIGEEHVFLAEHEAHFNGLGAQILASSPEVYRLCQDKHDSMMRLRAAGLDAPDTAPCDDERELHAFLGRNEFPIFLKPRAGVSSANIFKVAGEAQLSGLLGAFPDGHFVAQQFLDDQRDYTAGVYVAADGSFRETLLIERDLKFGLSYRGTIFEDPALSEYCLDVASAVGSRYSVNVQFKIVDGRPFAYEINPRLSSTTSVRAHFGFNEPELMLREALGTLAGHRVQKQTGRFTRYWQEHYLADA
jgi:carbamoyl-phosphate synthase large subunit